MDLGCGERCLLMERMFWRGVVFLQAEEGIGDLVRSRGLGDVYKRQARSRRAGSAWWPAAARRTATAVPASPCGRAHAGRWCAATGATAAAALPWWLPG